MKSIMQQNKDVCYLCGKPANWSGGIFDALEEHHIYEGNPKRRLSEKYGLKVYLHGIECHREGPCSAHKNRSIRLGLQAAGQRKFEETHGSREEFVRIFGKNYL